MNTSEKEIRYNTLLSSKVGGSESDHVLAMLRIGRSASWITDASGAPTQHLQYLPFGENFVDQRNTTWATPYTFSAKEKDQETGYSYFGARYYDSEMSIWLSVDPLRDMYPSTSPYMYVRGNPIMLIDPDGMKY